MRSLQLCEGQGIPGKLKKRVRNLVLAILTIYMETMLKSQFNSPFILYISTTILFSPVKRYVEVKINKHEIW